MKIGPAFSASVPACILVVLAMVVLSPPAQAEAVTVGDIIARWQARMDAMQSLSCSIAYETLVPKGILSSGFEDGREFPPEDWTYPTRNEMWMDLELRRARLEVRGQVIHADLGRLVPQNEVRLFDGENFQKFTPKEDYASQREAKVWVELQEFGENAGAFLDYGVIPLLYACAFLPAKDQSVSVTSAKAPPESGLFRITGTEDGHVILRTGNLRSRGRPSYYELWVDMERDAAIVRYVGHRSGYQWKTIDFAYDELQPAPWIPSGWNESRYKSDGRLSNSRTASVVSVQLNPGLEGVDFQMSAKPGMFVQSVPEDAIYFQQSAEKRIPAEHAVLYMEQTNWWRIVAIAMSIAVGMAIAVGIWLRSRLQSGT
jgi:hypothetical protein